MPSKIFGFFESLLNSIWNTIKSLPSEIYNLFKSLFDAIHEVLSNVWDAITSLPDLIINGIKKIFVPEEDFVSEKVAEIKENFAFADSVIESVDVIKSSINKMRAGEVPSVDIRMSNYTGNFGQIKNAGTVTFSMQWYSKYKATGDSIISAILWLGFIWAVFTRLPSIISGGSSAYVDYMKTQQYIDKHGGN